MYTTLLDPIKSLIELLNLAFEYIIFSTEYSENENMHCARIKDKTLAREGNTQNEYLQEMHN